MKVQVFRQSINSGQIYKPVSREQVAAALRKIADQLEQPFAPQPNDSWGGKDRWEAWFVNSGHDLENIQLVIAQTEI